MIKDNEDVFENKHEVFKVTSLWTKGKTRHEGHRDIHRQQTAWQPDVRLATRQSNYAHVSVKRGALSRCSCTGLAGGMKRAVRVCVFPR